MKVYSCPSEVPLPAVDYANYSHDKVTADENKHKEALKAHLIALGYTGEHTGKIYRVPVGDGYAQYMVADGGRSSVLIHLGYGDAYHSRDVAHVPKKVILERIARDAEFTAFWRTPKAP